MEAFADYAVPAHLLAFFAAYAADREPRRILDPLATSPLVATAVAEAVPEAEIVAFSPSKAVIEYGQLMAPRVDWRLSDSLADVVEPQEWDLVVSTPPVGVRAKDADLAVAPDRLAPWIWKTQRDLLIPALLASRLSMEGRIAIRLGEGLFLGRGGRALRDWLAANGVYLEASLSVLGGLPRSSLDTQISIFGPILQEELFVARVTPAAPIEEVVANLKSRDPAVEPELGMLVGAQRYRGWRPEVESLKLDRVLGRSPCIVTLGEITLSIEKIKLTRDEGSPDFDNTVFVPEVGTGPARTRIDWSGKGDTRSVFAIRLDPARADAEFIAGWLNGPAKALRQSFGVGVLPRIPGEDLGEMRVPLPPLENQIRNTEMRRQIAGILTELDALGERLASAFTSEALSIASTDLEVLRGGNDVDSWIARLPFPVASVLRRYRAEAEPRARLGHLLRFFEAQAIFCAVLLLSATRADPALWDQVRPTVARVAGGRRSPFGRPTFGTWLHLGRGLVDALRPLLIDAEDDTRSSVLGVSDSIFAKDLVLDDGLWELLLQALDIRNREVHGGGVSVAQSEEHLVELEELLGEMHRRYGRTFDRVRLVEPGELSYEKPLHRFARASYLLGADPVFTKGSLVSIMALEHSSLYLVDAEKTLETALELLPLVRLLSIPSGEGKACFFLNGVDERGGFRFVSMHWPAAPATVTDPVLSALIAELSTPAAG